MGGDKVNVFISWSGELSKRVAAVWRDLVEETFDSVVPFMSEESIRAGERGLHKIATSLAGTSFGIIVVTQANVNAPWLNFEAGALSKDVADPTVRVAPSLVDFEHKYDLTGPIGQFQASLLDRDGVEYILLELAKAAKADETSIKKRFANSWREEYEGRFDLAKSADEGVSAERRRSSDETLAEILTIVRELTGSTTPVDADDVQSAFGAVLYEDLQLMIHVVAEAFIERSTERRGAAARAARKTIVCAASKMMGKSTSDTRANLFRLSADKTQMVLEDDMWFGRRDKSHRVFTRQDDVFKLTMDNKLKFVNRLPDDVVAAEQLVYRTYMTHPVSIGGRQIYGVLTVDSLREDDLDLAVDLPVAAVLSVLIAMTFVCEGE
jgi:hypothetical protein